MQSMYFRFYLGLDTRYPQDVCISQVLNRKRPLYLQWKQPS